MSCAMAHALAHLQLLEQRHDGVAGLTRHRHGGATGRRVVDAVGVHGAGLLAPGANVHPVVGPPERALALGPGVLPRAVVAVAVSQMTVPQPCMSSALQVPMYSWPWCQM